MGSSREMTIAAIAEPALMLAIFTVAITAGSTNISQMLLRHFLNQKNCGEMTLQLIMAQ